MVWSPLLPRLPLLLLLPIQRLLPLLQLPLPLQLRDASEAVMAPMLTVNASSQQLAKLSHMRQLSQGKSGHKQQVNRLQPVLSADCVRPRPVVTVWLACRV